MKKILVLGVFALFIACNSSSNNVAVSDTSSSLATDSTKAIVAADSTVSASENTAEASQQANAPEAKLTAAAPEKPAVKTSQPGVLVKSPENNDHADIKKGELLISKSVRAVIGVLSKTSPMTENNSLELDKLPSICRIIICKRE